MSPIELTLPEPPSSNRYWRNVNGRMILSKEAREYRKAVALTCLRVFRGEPMVGPVSVTLVWHRGRKSGDLDNRIKQALDALQGSLIGDDAQICELHCFRADDKADPRLEVFVSPISRED